MVQGAIRLGKVEPESIVLSMLLESSQRHIFKSSIPKLHAMLKIHLQATSNPQASIYELLAE